MASPRHRTPSTAVDFSTPADVPIMTIDLFSLILAQSAPPRRSFEDWSTRDSVNLVIIVGILIVAIIIGGMLLMYLRRRVSDRESALAHPGSVMEELRRLRKEGKLSEAEYEASRRAATARLMPNAASSVSAGTPPAPPPARPRPMPAPRPQASADPNARVAKPGFDLTGAPLPKPGENKPDQ
jgi:hypothetical protein